MHGFVYKIDLAKIVKVKKDSRSTKFFLGKKEAYKDVRSINVCGIPTEMRVRQSKCMERRMKKAKKSHKLLSVRGGCHEFVVKVHAQLHNAQTILHYLSHETLNGIRLCIITNSIVEREKIFDL